MPRLFRAAGTGVFNQKMFHGLLLGRPLLACRRLLGRIRRGIRFVTAVRRGRSPHGASRTRRSWLAAVREAAAPPAALRTSARTTTPLADTPQQRASIQPAGHENHHSSPLSDTLIWRRQERLGKYGQK